MTKVMFSVCVLRENICRDLRANETKADVRTTSMFMMIRTKHGSVIQQVPTEPRTHHFSWTLSLWLTALTLTD